MAHVWHFQIKLQIGLFFYSVVLLHFSCLHQRHFFWRPSWSRQPSARCRACRRFARRKARWRSCRRSCGSSPGSWRSRPGEDLLRPEFSSKAATVRRKLPPLCRRSKHWWDFFLPNLTLTSIFSRVGMVGIFSLEALEHHFSLWTLLQFCTWEEINIWRELDPIL